MLDDKDDFHVNPLNHTYFDGAIEMIDYWWFGRREHDRHASTTTNKRVIGGYIKEWFKHFSPCIDKMLKDRNLIPYACTSPFDWEKCKEHVRVQGPEDARR